MGRCRRAERDAPHARVLPDGRYHVVGRLQRDVRGRRPRQRLQARYRRMGQHREPVGGRLSRRQTQTGRG